MTIPLLCHVVSTLTVTAIVTASGGLHGPDTTDYFPAAKAASLIDPEAGRLKFEPTLMITVTPSVESDSVLGLPKDPSDHEVVTTTRSSTAHFGYKLSDAESSALSMAPPPARRLAPSTPSVFRTGGRAELFDGVTIEGGMEEMGVNRRSALGSVSVSGGAGRATASMVDVSMMLDTFRAGGLAFQLVGGMRATSIDSPQLASSSEALAPLPVAGVGLRYDISPWASIRAVSVSGGAGGAAGGGFGRDPRASYQEYRIETALRLSGSTSLMVGYQRFDSSIERSQLQTTAKRDALLIELKLGF